MAPGDRNPKPATAPLLTPRQSAVAPAPRQPAPQPMPRRSLETPSSAGASVAAAASSALKESAAFRKSGENSSSCDTQNQRSQVSVTLTTYCTITLKIT